VREPRFTDKVDLTRPLQVEGKPVWERRFAAEQLDEQGKRAGGSDEA
jgi:hypothetical protein